MEEKQWQFLHWHKVNIILLMYDIMAVGAAYFLALWFRFDCRFSMIPPEYLGPYKQFIGIYIAICVIVFWFFKLYQSIWRFASYTELYRVILATGITLILNVLLTSFIYVICHNDLCTKVLEQKCTN